MMERLRSPSARHRWGVASRTLAAIFGGYAVTSLFNLALPLLLGTAGFSMPKTLVSALMASFLIWAAIIMAVFHARSAVRAWLWLVGAAVPLALIVWLLFPAVKP